MPSLCKVFSQGALQQAAGHGVCWLCWGCQELAASDPGCAQPPCSPGRAGKAEVEFVTLPWFGSQTRRLSPCFLKYVSKPCPRYQL